MIPKRFIFITNNAFERWSYDSPTKRGIGGSETAIVELSKRLAKRGFEVIVYVPLEKGVKSEWQGTVWKDVDEADFSLKGHWVICRSPILFSKFSPQHPDQKIYLQMQDVDYPMKSPQTLICDKFLALCDTHVAFTKNVHSEVAGRVVRSANGIRTDLIEEQEKKNKVQRDPHRIMYASSPDRGLVNLLKIFPKIRQRVPDATLHAFYGFDNIRKIVKDNIPIDDIGTSIKDLEKLMSQPGVTWHGRISQVELYDEWRKSGIWGYPTRFAETSCITSMEAQALGAIPVTNPFWALLDNVMYGSVIDGDPAVNPMTQIEYINEICYWMTNENVEKIRLEMIKKARERFDWERVVDSYIEMMDN